MNARVAQLMSDLGTFPGHLCCGELGRLDSLLEVAWARQEGGRIGVLKQTFRDCIVRARENGGYAFYTRAPEGMMPALFTGITGIGYLCERFIDPGNVPSVLCAGGFERMPEWKPLLP